METNFAFIILAYSIVALFAVGFAFYIIKALIDAFQNPIKDTKLKQEFKDCHSLF